MDVWGIGGLQRMLNLFPSSCRRVDQVGVVLGVDLG